MQRAEKNKIMVQYKIITIPVINGEREEDELNVFLRSRKIVDVEKQLVSAPSGAYWSFCVSYIFSAQPVQSNMSKKEKVDYKSVLDEASFARFTRYREIRRNLSQTEAIPAYAIFTDEELAELAKIETLTKTSMQKVNGIGEKKVEKYGVYFFESKSVE